MGFITATTKVDKVQNIIPSITPPTTPTINQHWVDLSTNPPIFKKWNGNEWVDVNLNVEKIDPTLILNIKEQINSAIGDINNSKQQIEEALNKSQEAIDKAGLNEESIENMKSDVDTAIKNSSDAINKSEQASQNASNAHELAQQSIDTLASFKDEVSGEITEIKASAEGLATEVRNKAEKSEVSQLASQISSKVENSEYQSFKTQTAGQIASVVSNQQNMWRDSGFEFLKLSEYTSAQDNWKTIFITTNGVKNTQSQKEQEYGQEFQINNNSDKALRFNGKTDGNLDLYAKDMYSVSVGDVLEFSFDFYKQGTGTLSVGVRWYDKDNNPITWSSVVGTTNNGGKWWHKNGKIVVPEYFNIKQSDGSFVKKYPSKIQPYIAFNKTGSTSDFCYVDNVKIIKQASSQTFQSQTVDSLVSRVSNNEGKITEVTKKADGILTTINDTSTGLEATYNKVESANGTLTEIKNLEGSSSIVNTVKGLNIKVENKAEKSEVTQLAGQVSTVVESQDSMNKQIQTATSNISSLQNNQGQINQRLDTVDGTIQIIERDIDENEKVINQVKSTADSNTTTITDTKNKLTQVETDLDGVRTTVSNIRIGGTNLYNDGNFENGTYKAYPVNSSNIALFDGGFDKKCLKITPKVGAESGVLFRPNAKPKENTEYTFSCWVKTPVTCQIKSVGYWMGWSGSTNKGYKFDIPSSTWTKISITRRTGTGTPDNWGFTVVREVDKTTPEYFWIDNVKIEEGNIATDWSPSNEDINGEFSEIKQTSNEIKQTVADLEDNLGTKIQQNANNITLIASGNETSYFQVSGDYIYAKSKTLMLDGNVKVGDGFIFSANNIKTGTLRGSKPDWYTDGSVPNVPKSMKQGLEGVPSLVLFNPRHNGDKTNGLYMYDIDPPKTGLDGKILYTNMASIKDDGISFRSIYWDNDVNGTGSSIGYTNPIKLKSFFDEKDYSNTGLEISTGVNTGLKIVTSNAFEHYNNDDVKKVIIGTDGRDKNKSSVVTSTLYTSRVQSLNDGSNEGITFNDEVTFEECVKSSGMWLDVKPKGDGGYFRFGSGGKWNVDGKSINHFIGTMGPGYILAIGNDNKQSGVLGPSDLGTGSLYATNYYKKPSSLYSDEVTNYSLLDKATDDILKVQPSLFKTEKQINDINRWEEEGRPSNEYEALDRRSKIGFSKEELSDFESLKSLLEVETDENGLEQILGIDYSSLLCVLISLCQKQQNQINELQEKVAKIEIEKKLKGE